MTPQLRVIFFFPGQKKRRPRAGVSYRFIHRLRIVAHRFTDPLFYGPFLVVYGFLGAGGVVVDGVGLVPKSTVGGASLPGAASKYVRGLAPITFAVIACGKVLM